MANASRRRRDRHNGRTSFRGAQCPSGVNSSFGALQRRRYPQMKHSQRTPQIIPHTNSVQSLRIPRQEGPVASSKLSSSRVQHRLPCSISTFAKKKSKRMPPLSFGFRMTVLVTRDDDVLRVPFFRQEAPTAAIRESGDLQTSKERRVGCIE